MSIVVNVIAWLVFVYDLFVHIRLERHYLRTKVGVFDLVIVIITAPWFLLPGFGGSQILVLARLARLVRLFFVSKGARQLGRRLGSVGLFSVAMLLFCSWMAYVAEHPANPGFATFGDSIWWGIVTMTTVGYGDIVPETQKGRLAGVFLMLTGVATLGVISGTLASAFRSSSRATAAEDAADQADEGAATNGTAETGDTATTDDLQAQLADLQAHLVVKDDPSGEHAQPVLRQCQPVARLDVAVDVQLQLLPDVTADAVDLVADRVAGEGRWQPCCDLSGTPCAPEISWSSTTTAPVR